MAETKFLLPLMMWREHVPTITPPQHLSIVYTNFRYKKISTHLILTSGCSSTPQAKMQKKIKQPVSLCGRLPHRSQLNQQSKKNKNCCLDHCNKQKLQAKPASSWQRDHMKMCNKKPSEKVH